MELSDRIHLWAQAMLQQAAWYKLDNNEARLESSQLLAEHFVKMLKFLSVDFIFEIGAHEASFSRRAAALYPQKKIFAFEANPEVWATYNSEIKETFSNLDYRNLAISNRKEQTSLIKYSNLNGKNGQSATKRFGLLERRGGIDEHRITVQAETLDNIIKQESLSKNAALAIWIDAEGSTEQIFAGGANALRQCVAIYLEVDCVKFWKDCWLEKDVYTTLINLGFLPTFRDFLWDTQYNMIWVREAEARRLDFFNGLFIQRCVYKRIRDVLNGENRV